jgi:hypothetical protein
MIETSSELPTPAEMWAFNEANRATWQAVRMREASHAFVTGHIALGICLPGTYLSLEINAPFVLFALLFGYLGCLFWAIRRIKGQRLKSLVKVTDRLDDELAAKPRKAVLYVFGMMSYYVLCNTGWTILRRHMSTATHLASLAIFPLMCIGYFVHRAVRLAFWEYFLFAMCIPLAYLPIFFHPGPTTPLSFLALILVIVSTASMVLVIVGAASLYHRWEVWSRSLDDLASEQAGEEVAS